MEQKINKKNIISVVLLILYMLFTFILVLHHEIWRDEAQAWLVVRDLDLGGIIAHVRTEGHPLLWYFVILPFAKLLHGVNAVFSMQILNWFLVAAGAGVFVLKAPFNNYLKVSVLLSSGFLYWYPTMARSYCFIPLLMFLLAVFYPKQKVHPFIYAFLLIALANTHVIMFGFCFALAIVFAIQSRDKKHILASVCIFASLLSIIVYLWGSQSENVVVSAYHNNLSFENLKNIYEKIVFNINGFSNVINTFIFGLLTVLLGIALYLKDKKIFFVYISNFLWQFSIFFFVWNLLPQRAYAMLLSGLFCFWVVYGIGFRLKSLISVLMSLMFLLSFPEAFKLIKQDYLFTFSDGKNTAEFIKKNIPQDAFIVSNFPLTTTAVSVYLPKDKWKLWYEGYENYYTYTIWNKTINPHYTPLPIQEMVKKHNEIYVLMSAGSFYENVKPLYESDKSVIAEKFYIYKFGVKNHGK